MHERLEHALDKWAADARRAAADPAPILAAVRRRRAARRARITAAGAACASLLIAAALALPSRPQHRTPTPVAAADTAHLQHPSFGALRADYERSGEPAADWRWSLAWTRSTPPL